MTEYLICTIEEEEKGVGHPFKVGVACYIHTAYLNTTMNANKHGGRGGHMVGSWHAGVYTCMDLKYRTFKNIRTGGYKSLSQATVNGNPYTYFLQCVNFKWSRNKTSHHLQILLYSHQHLLPTRSALHHDDPSHLPHTVELYYPGKE